ncbi:hypothetical protein ACFLZ1_01495, partial [Patescibacteria group bacterium]
DTNLLKAKNLLKSFLVALVFILPFLLLNKDEFIYDTILLQQISLPRLDGLTFFSTMHFQFNIAYKFIYGFIFLSSPFYSQAFTFLYSGLWSIGYMEF